MPFIPYYIIAEFDTYEEITRFRRTDGLYSYNPIKGQMFTDRTDAELVMDAIQPRKGCQYFLMCVEKETLP